MLETGGHFTEVSEPRRWGAQVELKGHQQMPLWFSDEWDMWIMLLLQLLSISILLYIVLCLNKTAKSSQKTTRKLKKVAVRGAAVHWHLATCLSESALQMCWVVICPFGGRGKVPDRSHMLRLPDTWK